MGNSKRQLRRRKSLSSNESNTHPPERESKSGAASSDKDGADNDLMYSPTKKGQSSSVLVPSTKHFSFRTSTVGSNDIMWTNRVALVITATSALWSLFYILVGGTTRGKKLFAGVASRMFQDAKGGVPIVALAMPVLISGCVCMLLLQRPHPGISTIKRRTALPRQIPSSFQRLLQYCRAGHGHGDWNFNNFAIAFLLFPCTMYLLGCVDRHLHGKELGAEKKVVEIANSFGMMTCVAMSFFLIPVARHSPILKLLKLGQAHVVILHIWSGRIIFVGVTMHGGMHMYRWVRFSGERLRTMLFPPMPCYKRSTDYEPTCNDPDTDCSCYDLLRNLTGFLALLALVAIGLTSLNYVRRLFYKVFYMSHIIAGPIMIITTVLHYNRAILFMAPSLLYYMASSAPVIVESWRKLRKDKGVRILSVKSISDTDSPQQRPCVSVTFEASDVAMERYSPGQYVQLVAPSVSAVHHPFTINIVPGKPNQVRLIFRVTGAFTSGLASHLQPNNSNTPLPVIQLDGYHGAPNRVDQLLCHDVAILVAGGIGITPFLSMLHEVNSVLSTQQHLVTRRVILHWICRDASLAKYVTKEYFDPILQQAGASAEFQIQILVHMTGHTSGSGMHNSRSYTDLESPQRLTDVEEDNDGLGQGEETASDTIVGMPFTPSRFVAGSKSRLVSNFIPFCGFASIAWVGLAAIWYLYRNVQEKHAVASRGWSIVAIALIGILCSIAINLLLDAIGTDGGVSYSILPSNSSSLRDNSTSWWRRATAASMNDKDELVSSGETTDGEEEIEMENVKENPQAGVFTGIDENKGDSLSKNGVTLEEKQGRPSVHELLKSVDGASCPGVFSCGPTNMMADIRSAAQVRCSMRIQHCIRGTPQIAVYEEAFEM